MSKNLSFLVGSPFECGMTSKEVEAQFQQHFWRHTLIGCRILLLLQEMYDFSIDYQDFEGGPHSGYSSKNTSVQIYARPMPLLNEEFRDLVSNDYYPVQEIFPMRVGFLLRRDDFGLFKYFYIEPFSHSVWFCLFGLIVMSTLACFVMNRWEVKIFQARRECSLAYEFLLALAACCQQTPAFRPRLTSRRTAWCFVSMFTFITYSFYTSNLVSHLVSDRDTSLSLHDLTQSNHYEYTVLDSLKEALKKRETPLAVKWLKSRFAKNRRSVSITAGLEEVRSGSVALLSDYATLYTHIPTLFEDEVICQLAEVDAYPNFHYYLFTAKNFTLKQEFKIGSLRLLESGLLRLQVTRHMTPRPSCITKPTVSVQLVHVAIPLAMIPGACALAVLIAILEKIHFVRSQRFRGEGLKPFLP